MANPSWFSKDPRFAWGFYGHRLNLYRDTNPHDGFRILLDIATSKKHGYFVYTSNVDGQFQKAGFDKNKIVECHGSIHFNQCINNCTKNIWDNKDEILEIDQELFYAKEPVPGCKHCNNIARPNILMFGDWNWNSKRTDLQENDFYDWLRYLQIQKAKVCIVEVGAGLAIPTIRMLSEEVLRKVDAHLIRINPRDDLVPDGQFSIKAGGLEGIKLLA